MIVIGSVALSKHGFNVQPKDIDLVGTYEEALEFRKKFEPVEFYPINKGKSIFMRGANGLICEIEIAWPGSRAEKFIQFLQENKLDHSKTSVCRYKCVLPSLDVLYMLKMSHRFLKDSPHFLKTMHDIQKLRYFGCEIISSEAAKAWFKQREIDTYTYQHPKLNVDKSAFFDAKMTGVVQKYDHDSVHEAVKHLDKPAYMYFKPEDQQVLCSKEMFHACSIEVQVYSVVEEAMVLAIERSLVPHPGKKTPREAFEFALMKVCTSITSGWWREFAWEHYDVALAWYNDSYFEKFKEAVKNGLVKENK